MNYPLREEDVFAIHLVQDQQKDMFLDSLEQLGIPFRPSWRQAKLRPQDTNVFVVNVNEKCMEYRSQPFICAAMASNGVRFYSAQEFCRLAELGFPKNTRRPFFHVPHDGNRFPEELMKSVCVSREAFFAYHAAMRDVGVRDLIPEEYRGAGNCECFPVSRLLCDVERFVGPEEVMERYGMGFCYERAYDGTKIKQVTEKLRSRTLRYYSRHHDRMDALCEKSRRLVLFDLHSYHDEIVPRELLKDTPTPDVCIGTDTHFTPPVLVQLVRDHLEAAGFSTAVNDPYAGTFVPNAVMQSRTDCDLISIMLEFHKRVYCDAQLVPNPEKQMRIQQLLRPIVADIIASVA